jgi:hypothetical protein
MTSRRIALFAFLLSLLYYINPLPAAANPEALSLSSPTNLAVTGLSVYTVWGDSPQRITISFRVVNLSTHDVTQPFRTSISPGANGVNNLLTFFVTTRALPAKQTVYVARTVTLPAGTSQLTVRVEADVDHVLTDTNRGNNVATTLFHANPTTGYWVSIGPTRINAPSTIPFGAYSAVGRLAAIAIDPSDTNVIYVGSPGQLGHEGSGVWKTYDAGRTWQPLTDSFPTLSIAAIAVDPGGAFDLLKHVYVVASDYGLYRSDDDGTSWVHVFGNLNVRRNTDIGDPTHLLIDPNQFGTLYLTTKTGVLRSKTGGATWEDVLGYGEATALVMDPVNTQVLYASIRTSSGINGVYRTADGGNHWSQENLFPMSAAPRYGILLGISHPASQPAETVYALMGLDPGHAGFRLFRSVGGGTWSPRSSCESDECDHFWVLDVDPSDPDRIYLGGFALYIFENGGTAWTRVPAAYNDRQPASPHGDYHGWAIDPTDPNIVYAASDGGLFRSTLKGEEGSWAFVGEGITNAEVYDVAASAKTSKLIAGTQDNGTILYSGFLNIPQWGHIYPEPPFGGDGGLVAIDPTDDLKLYAMTQAGDSLVLTRNGGLSFGGLGGLGTDCNNYNMTFYFQLDPSQPTLVWAACTSLVRKDINGGGPLWPLVFAPPAKPPSRVVRSAIDPGSKLVYAGLADGRIFSGTFPQPFKKMFQHPKGLNVTDMEVDPKHPQRLYVTFSPPTVTDRNCFLRVPRIYLFQATDMLPKTSSTSGSDITGNLPANLCVNTIAADPSTDGALLVGTQKGVYRGLQLTDKKGSKTWFWYSYSLGMPPADVRDLEYQPVTQRLLAATFGRGVFMMSYAKASGE